MARRTEDENPPDRRIWPRVLIGVLFLAVTALIIGTLASTRIDAPASSEPYTPSPLVTPTPQPTASVTKHPPPTRLLLALSATAAWRAPVGSCPGTPATLEYTTDAGATWKPSTSAGALGATSVIDLERGLNGAVSAVGQIPDACVPQQLTTISRADKWHPVDGPVVSWFVVPGSPASINTPAGPVPTPCAVINSVLAGTAVNVAVLCDDERLFRSQDAGKTWDGGLWVPGAMSLGGTKQGYIVAAVGTPMCTGVQLEIFSPKAAPRDRSSAGCHATSADLGTVQVAVGADTVWLWVGDEIKPLTRDGTTWK
jgi:hypothetical protein